MMLNVPQKLKSTRGSALIAVLIASVLGAIIMQSMMTMVSKTGQYERGLSSNLDMNSAVTLIEKFLESPGVCSLSGLVDVDLSPLLAIPTPTPVPVTLSLPSAVVGGKAIVASSGMMLGNHRWVETLQFTNLNPNGVNSYIANLELKTAVTGNAKTMRSPIANFKINLTLDANKKIKTCSMAPNDPLPNVACNSSYFACVKTPKILTVTTPLVMFPSAPHIQDLPPKYYMIHARGTASCPAGWRPTGAGANCEFTANTWEAGSDQWTPTGGGWMLASYPNSSSTGWVIDCAVMVRKELVDLKYIVDGHIAPKSQGAMMVTCVPE